MNINRKRLILYVLGLILSGFVLLSLVVFFIPETMLDLEFSEEVQEHQYPILDFIMKLISFPGQRPYSIFLIIATALSFYIFKYKREAFFILLTSLSGVISHSLKILIDRPRPTESVVRIIEKAEYQSFPSGHVLFYVIFFGFLIVLMYHLKSIPKPLKWILSLVSFFLIFTVPFSRMYLGAHWFTDVAGAFLLGLLYLYILSYWYFKKSS